jgi:hypothetical protein
MKGSYPITPADIAIYVLNELELSAPDSENNYVEYSDFINEIIDEIKKYKNGIINGEKKDDEYWTKEDILIFSSNIIKTIIDFKLIEEQQNEKTYDDRINNQKIKFINAMIMKSLSFKKSMTNNGSVGQNIYEYINASLSHDINGGIDKKNHNGYVFGINNLYEYSIILSKKIIELTSLKSNSQYSKDKNYNNYDPNLSKTSLEDINNFVERIIMTPEVMTSIKEKAFLTTINQLLTENEIVLDYGKDDSGSSNKIVIKTLKGMGVIDKNGEKINIIKDIKSRVDGWGNSSDDPIPEMLWIDGSEEFFNNMMNSLSLMGTVTTLYDLAKMIKWATGFVDFPVADGHNSHGWDWTSKLIGTDSSAAGALLPDGIGQFVNINFSDKSIGYFLEFMTNQENDVYKELSIKNKKLLNPDFTDNMPDRIEDISRIGYKNNFIDEFGGSFPKDKYVQVYPVKTFIFYDLYPIRLSHSPFSFDETDGITTFDVTFRYSHFEQK